ncbi:uncharacterized protein [Diabrotica undecimpunctata]|uniref:uncharacterized protein n=1 Tax=Diabrotica undecimpunctata TaxID=50387 RepID=UPI003B641BB1
MGFFDDIRNDYGQSTVRILKDWTRITIKLAALHNQKTFLLKCRSNGCFPGHVTNGLVNVNSLLHHRTGNIHHDAWKLCDRFGRNIINLEIKIAFADINFFERKLHELRTKAYNILNFHTFNEFNRRQRIKYNTEFHKIKKIQINKFNKLKIEAFDKIKFQEKWFKNLTSIHFPFEIKKFLALGPKFSLCPSKSDIRVPNLLSDIESIIRPLNDSQKDVVRSKCTNVITNFLHKEVKDHFLNKYYMQTKLFLKNHPEIYIVKSDKGNVTVVMYKEDYLQKTGELLNDTKYYTTLRRSPVCTLQQKANCLVSKLNIKKFIDNKKAKELKIYNSIAPRFYALPKIHKPTLSMRPIVSSLCPPNGPIAQLLTDILTNAYNLNNNFYIKDSFDFSSFINNFQLPQNYVLVSFDVTSLFTNLPLDLIISSVEKHWNEISQHTNIDLLHFKTLINFVFDSNIFIFNGVFYKQIFGSPMGSSLSPILSSYVMDDVISDCINIELVSISTGGIKFVSVSWLDVGSVTELLTGRSGSISKSDLLD